METPGSQPEPRDPGVGPVLVTGGNGYIASWVVKLLLDLGFSVRATVRDPADRAKTGHLLSMAAESPGNLTLFQADLLESGGFDRAMANCGLVFHTASPVAIRGVADPVRELVELGMTFRPAAEAIVDHFQQLLDDGLVNPARGFSRRP